MGCTSTVSVSVCALSGQYVLNNGTPQSSLSTGLEDICIVLGSFLGLAGRINLLSTGVTAGCTLTVSVLICALSGQYVLNNGTLQSSLSTGLEEICIMLGSFLRLAERINLLSTGVAAGCTSTVSVSIRALSGQYVLNNGTPQTSLLTGLEDLCIVLGSFLGLAGRINLLSTGVTVGCTSTVSVSIRALSGQYVLKKLSLSQQASKSQRADVYGCRCNCCCCRCHN